MKIGIKVIIFWVASLSLFAGAGFGFLLFPDLLNGTRGLFLSFFLGYCAIIVAAQALAFIELIRRQRQNTSEKSRSYQTGIESA